MADNMWQYAPTFPVGMEESSLSLLAAFCLPEYAQNIYSTSGPFVGTNNVTGITETFLNVSW
jgi:hypothetical protein